MKRLLALPTFLALVPLALALGLTPSAPAADRMVIAEDLTGTW